MAQHGKRYRQARAPIDRERDYSPIEAIRMLKGQETVKFDETVEVHFRLGLNVRHADEQLRGTLMLPHGTGKDVRVAVFESASTDGSKEILERHGYARIEHLEPGTYHSATVLNRGTEQADTELVAYVNSDASMMSPM